ncbi:Succinate semialdehyde dehydrogenase Sad [Enhygromyxa salina]|uniref:Succinate semialdehyde dehydrogenase Sad n=1 Tax=Enhygromyxa salina TaxID=215803 RepID=A0A2S9YGL9_9BACT|nr:aldehyde dehydrogenase family protein [Enhygromyxa salina]PRQ04156.1 Succinate semialdehyde dehydrogenase Sad [Enhygromyxa salina]
MPEPIVSPIDGQVAYEFEYLDDAAAMAALDRAREAQREWRRSPIEDRAALCLRMLDAYEAKLDQHTREITTMMGKPLAEAQGEVRTMRGRVEALAALAPAALADELLPELDGFHRAIRHEPVGVVLNIAAWNYPLVVPINVVAAAVLAGDAVLLKHAPQTALCGRQLAASFAEAGAPAGLVTDFMVRHETVARALDSRKINQVAFTGSVRGGHEVYRAAAARNFIGVGLELGGKDPALVLPDCELEFTVANLVEGAFYNAGQSCCAVERIYVHEQIWAAFVEAYVAQTHTLKLGDPLAPGTTLGPVVNARAAARVAAQVEAAIEAGARQLIDDSKFEVPDRSPCYLAPKVLVDVDHSMALMRDETFGPAIGLIKVRDHEHALALMNDSAYGLTASIWSRDDAIVDQLAAELEAGTVFQNRCDYLDPQLPWVGVKDSGHGVSLSHLGLRALTRPKSLHFRR